MTLSKDRAGGELRLDSSYLMTTRLIKIGPENLKALDLGAYERPVLEALISRGIFPITAKSAIRYMEEKEAAVDSDLLSQDHRKTSARGARIERISSAFCLFVTALFCGYILREYIMDKQPLDISFCLSSIGLLAFGYLGIKLTAGWVVQKPREWKRCPLEEYPAEISAEIAASARILADPFPAAKLYVYALGTEAFLSVVIFGREYFIDYADDGAF